MSTEPGVESPKDLVNDYFESKRRARVFSVAFYGFALIILVGLAVNSLYSNYERSQRSVQINQEFIRQFQQIEKALKQQDDYFTCRVGQSGQNPSPQEVAKCVEPFTNVAK